MLSVTYDQGQGMKVYRNQVLKENTDFYEYSFSRRIAAEMFLVTGIHKRRSLPLL